MCRNKSRTDKTKKKNDPTSIHNTFFPIFHGNKSKQTKEWKNTQKHFGKRFLLFITSSATAL